MGHVDHGKTSLIDAIRKSNVAQGEAGAITQHIGAFRCHTAVGDITILDTPGHEAFSAMRTRGADVTDLVVLVIAGDEGIRAQTIEALKQAEEAKVQVLVAINKMDKPGFNADNIYRQLSEHNLLPEVWGGQTITVNCSAITGAGIKELLETLALQAEVLELKANPRMRARGSVIESQMHKGFGAVTTVLVQNGTLNLGDALVFDQEWGRVKTMHDEFGNSLEHAAPSTPVKITGLSGLPEAGSEFIVVKNEKEARLLSEGRLHIRKHVALQVKKAGVEGLLQDQAQKQEKKVLHLILRADVQGSLEALKQSIEKIQSEKINVLIISAEVGAISESDIQLAGASKATIIGFHTQVETRAESLIKSLKVKVRLHDIIYHAIDDIKEIMVSLLDKIAQENDTGEALVKAIFKSSQLGSIAGCQVTEGTIRRNNHIRLVRDKEVLWKGPLASLKRLKDDAKEVSKGMECGILLQGFTALKEGDLIQAYDLFYLTQEL
ncbi:MAG: translation initiation factor IF-2 [Rhabdochlamydiaceae bacterium]|jgi:translation initiation factor IF-2